MSRSYDVRLEIAGFDPARKDAICSAVEGEDFEFTVLGGPDVDAKAVVVLYGDETIEQFASDLALAVFKANGGVCSVHVESVRGDTQLRVPMDFGGKPAGAVSR